MKVDINVLKLLREETNAPLKDCKEALIEAQGDIEKAKEILRKKGALVAAKKSDRETKEWIVKVKDYWDKFIVIKLACETDFVAKNELFHMLANELIEEIYKSWKNNVDEELKNILDQKVFEYIGKIWENIKLLDVVIWTWRYYIYTHPWDKLVSVVYYEWDENLAKEISLQVAAMDPKYISIEDVPLEYINELRAEFEKEVDNNKPKDVIEKIIEWKIKKYLNEIVLLEQPYIRDETKKVKDIIEWNFKILKIQRINI